MMLTASTCALRPAAPFTHTHGRRVPALAARSSTREVRCRAEEQQQQQQPAEVVPQPPVPPSAAAEKDKFDYREAPDALGPVGNFFMAALLIALCGASVFFTVGRQFQADLVPLVAEEYEQMMAEASK